MSTYEARGRVYVMVEEKVSTDLFTFTDAVVERLVTTLDSVGQSIATAARSSMSAHGKSGHLAGSVKVKTKVFGKKTSVWSAISAGGTKTSAYAHLFEKGFSGQEKVRAHQRVTRSIVASVGQYDRSVTYPAHPYLENALNARRTSAREAVLAAISDAASDRGLAA